MPDLSTGSSNVQAYILALTFYLIVKLSEHLYTQKNWFWINKDNPG